MKIGNTELPGKCPPKCPLAYPVSHEIDACFSCPIFNCTEEESIMSPEEYRPDWAEAWKVWFDTGMHGYPELPLKKQKDEESSCCPCPR